MLLWTYRCVFHAVEVQESCISFVSKSMLGTIESDAQGFGAHFYLTHPQVRDSCQARTSFVGLKTLSPAKPNRYCTHVAFFLRVW